MAPPRSAWGLVMLRPPTWDVVLFLVVLSALYVALKHHRSLKRLKEAPPEEIPIHVEDPVDFDDETPTQKFNRMD